MTDRELLKEARDALGVVTAYIENGTPLPPDDDPYWKASTALVNLGSILSRIDSALADTGNIDAHELVKKIRDESRDFAGSDYQYTLTNSEAVALIEQYAKRVPRAMLREIGENSQWNGLYEDIYQMQDEIAAKYGYKVEDKDE